jgi:hypothetical protein
MNMHMSLTPTQRRLYEERKAREMRRILAAKRVVAKKEVPAIELKPEEPIKKPSVEIRKEDFIYSVPEPFQSIQIAGFSLEKPISDLKIDALTMPSCKMKIDGFSTKKEIKIFPETMKEIVLDVLKSFNGITFDLIISHRRSSGLILPRFLSVYMVKKYKPSKSLPELGRFFKRDHTSILHAINRIQEKIDNGILDGEIAEWKDKYGRVGKEIAEYGYVKRIRN